MSETADRRPWQFSIGAVVVVTFLIAVSLSFYTWIGLIGSLVVLGVLGGLALGMRGILTKQRWMTAVGLCMIATSTLALLYDMTYVMHWSGGYTLNVHIDVFEANTGQPVPGAAVSISRAPYNPQIPLYGGVTDANGRAECVRYFKTGGKISGLEITAPAHPTIIPLSGFVLHIEAKGYEPVTILLSDATGEEQWGADGKFLNATVSLTRSP